VAGHCRGLIDQDIAAVLAAADYARETGRAVEHAEALEDAAVLAAAAGDEASARKHAADALRQYARLGAQWDIRRAGQRLRAAGLSQVPRTPRVRAETGWDALTPTETLVAQLVALGLSNPDIAARLFLSRNTVQTHVSHILAKLGAASRMEIIRSAAARPAAPGQ
jgi:DNA-binding NarL/FixJ family response regulator